MGIARRIPGKAFQAGLVLQERMDLALGQLQINPLETPRCPDTKNGGMEIARG